MRNLLLICILLSAAISTIAQPAPVVAAFTVLRPLPGKEQDFYAGYKRHLQWHRSRHDTLSWYGWVVTAGAREGCFIDATVDNAWRVYPNRVDMQGDLADNAINVSPYANWVDHQYWVLKAAYGQRRSKRLTHPVIHAFHLQVRPGYEREFDSYLAAFTAALRREAPMLSCYVLSAVNGPALPAYMVLLGYDNNALTYSADIFTASLYKQLPAKAAEAAIRRFRACISTYHTETWSYKADLSYFPGE